ncbi:alpha-L-rhamnosidase-related protein [Streptantibioticus silvisoli]|uniref:Alpha-L-rhamnosidase C-terminal domain-containing protein n=1 Tax=Streptantibioticus silvisoli TaxID=2705255 RepID=A0ABT6VV21_9ACTN|nr:alpha-L-rhamnosidase C-terminal domain-containing protein [Streptantibioticus silvisoli]MDI5962315.1 alpha-L-rhamnosidase C-terminal domain-containing protein [Streptantibioticus silvisoli]
MSTERRTRRRRRAVAALGCAFALLTWASAQPASVAAAAPQTPWPTAPDWQSYVETPTSATVCPTAVVSTSGGVTGAQNLVCGASGGATLTLASGGATPTIVLDYGKNVGGIPYFDVSAESGSPTLQAGYSESQRYLTATGDNSLPWAEGDPARHDSYTVSAPGTITNHYEQGGERYEEITLTSPGTLTLSTAGLHYIADRTTADGYQGYFVSSSDELNKIWYDGAYTAQLDSADAGTMPGDWSVDGGVLDDFGGNAGLLKQGSGWGDYTTTFDTRIVSNQAGWVVRGQDANNGYVFILNAANDTAGTPNTLQEFDLHGGTYTSVGSVALPSALAANTWHTVSTTTSGTSVTVSVDQTKVATLDTSSLPSGTSTYPTGTVGLREYNGEEADFRNLSVVSSAGATLYSNALSSTAALSDFSVPGGNALPTILDGATRDRAVWSGDINVEGPTSYYSTDHAADLKGALQLLGSYQLSSGFVAGDEPPQTPLHTGAPIQGTTGSYSASYSMYFLLGLGSYYLYTGDTAFIQQEWPVVKSELAWNATQLDSNGLLVTNSDDGADWDFYDGDKTGEVTEYNVLYYQALLDGAQIATGAGQSAQAATYTQQAAALKTAINAHLFNTSTGLYSTSDTQTTGVAQDANALAVLYGVAPAANRSSILAALKTKLWTTPYGPLPFSAGSGDEALVSPFVSGYELDARLANDDTADAEQLLTNVWGHMIAPGADSTGTMWENVSGADGTPGLGSGTSLAHGWSTTPTSALSGYVLGIQPTSPGYAGWSVQPHPGDLTWAEGQAPTPHGALQVSWAGQSGVDQFAMSVTAPSGTSGTIAVPTYGASNPVVSVNGQVVWSGGAFTATTGIGGAHQDGDYVYLTGVQPGTFVVASNQGGAATPTGYTSCAQQNGTCAFTGTQSVAYGANGIYSYRTATGGTACDDTALTDADFGFVKSCYVGPVTNGPSGSAYCAPENGLCAFSGSRKVAFGANGTFTTKTLTSGTPCTDTVFGDPVSGTVKACYLLPS